MLRAYVHNLPLTCRLRSSMMQNQGARHTREVSVCIIHFVRPSQVIVRHGMSMILNKKTPFVMLIGCATQFKVLYFLKISPHLEISPHGKGSPAIMRMCTCIIRTYRYRLIIEAMRARAHRSL